jgi:hypothetical protein
MVDDGIGLLSPNQRRGGWPFWPPLCLPVDRRKLLTRGGFFRPSLAGGLPLLELFSPRPSVILRFLRQYPGADDVPRLDL